MAESDEARRTAMAEESDDALGDLQRELDRVQIAVDTAAVSTDLKPKYEGARERRR